MRAEHNAWEQIASDERNQRKKTESEVGTVLAVPCHTMLWCAVLRYVMLRCGVVWCGSEL